MPLQSPFQSICTICDGGYRWVRAPEVLGEMSTPSPRSILVERDETGQRFVSVSVPWKFEPPYLTDGFPAVGRVPARRIYDPLHEHPALFRNFAAVDPTPKGIIEFANRYGTLGSQILLRLRQPGSEESASTFFETWGEPYSAWKYEILAIRYLLALWDALQSPDPADLSRFVVWRKAERVEFLLEPKLPGHPFLTASMADLVSSSCRPGDLTKPALYFIGFALNIRLPGFVSPSVDFRIDGSGFDLNLKPYGIAGTVWLQFARSVSGERDYRSCAECGTWFEISPEAETRISRRYCSNACRSKSYRGRTEKARKLFARNVPPKEIAKELGTDLATVRRWISRHE